MRDLPIVDVGWFLGIVQGVQVVYMDGRVTADAFARYLRVLAQVIDEQTVPQGVLYDIPEPASLTARRRKALAEVLERRRVRVRALTLGYALVTPSPFVRGILTAVFWLAPPPYESKVAGSLQDGFRWLAARCPGVDAAQACETYLWLKPRCLQQMAEMSPAASQATDAPR